TLETVATSCWFGSPSGTVEPPEAVVSMIGGTHVLRLPLAKSFSVAVSTSDERVSARKFVKQPPPSPSSVVRSIPVSTNVLESWLVGVHGVVIVASFASAHELSFSRVGGGAQIDPLNDASSTGCP